MITSRIRTYDTFPRLTEEITRRTIRALDAAAAAGATVASAAAGPKISTFRIIPAHPIGEGFASGIKANNPLFRIFDHGSLGKRNKRLKKDIRKESWPVSRRGSDYTAHRRSTDTGGVAPRNITVPARIAGRRALLASIRRHI